MGNFHEFKRLLYDYYKSKQKGDLSYEDFFDLLTEYKGRKDKYIVYVGKKNNKIVYVGTTIRYPISRWFYHKQHGKDFDFEEVFRFNNQDDMLSKEFELIKQYRPIYNKITRRKQNLNVALTKEELENRKGNPEWCQCCFKRRVNKGYTYCFACGRL